MGNRFRYDAFISYRHCLPDSVIAERLQNQLESFRLPKEIAESTRKTRPLRVFRDETELSVADDLSEAITTALWDSKYLICVCSPQYLESVWCMKEVEAFLRINDRKHILLVLADGEPETSFPEVLLYEEVFQLGADGRPVRVKQYKEPLAADCRGESDRERKAKTDIAVVRLMAVIKKISFEELSQRHRKETYTRARNRVLVGFAALLAIIAVCVFFIVRITKQKSQISRQQDELQAQKNEIEEQRNTIQQKYTDSMAGVSENLLRDGRRKDAVYAARSVLPDEASDDYSENSLRALSSALGIYELPDHITSDDMIQSKGAISVFDISPMGGYVCVRGLNFERSVIEISSGKILLSYQEPQYADAGFDGDRGFVFQREDENYTYLDFASGKEKTLDIGDEKIIFDPLGNGYASIADNVIRIFRGTEVLCRLDLGKNMSSEELPARSSIYVYFSPEGDKAWIFIFDHDSGTTYIYSADLLSGSVERRYTDHSGIYDYQSDGKSMLCLYDSFSSEKKLLLKDLETGEEKRADWKEAFSGFQVFGDDVVIHDQTKIYILNRNLEVIKTIDADAGLSLSALTPDGIMIFDSKDGGYLIRDGQSRFFDPDVADTKMFWAKDYADGTIYLSETGDDQINTFSFRKTDYLTPYSGTPEQLTWGVWADEPEITALKDRVLEKAEFGPEMIYSVTICENADYAAFQLWDGRVYIYRSSSAEAVNNNFEADGFIHAFYYDEKGGNYYISTEKNVEICDERFRSIGSIYDCRLSGYDAATGHPVVSHKREDDDYDYYLVLPVKYEDLIRKADDYLSGYQPNDRIKAKYGLK